MDTLVCFPKHVSNELDVMLFENDDFQANVPSASFSVPAIKLDQISVSLMRSLLTIQLVFLQDICVSSQCPQGTCHADLSVFVCCGFAPVFNRTESWHRIWRTCGPVRGSGWRVCEHVWLIWDTQTSETCFVEPPAHWGSMCHVCAHRSLETCHQFLSYNESEWITHFHFTFYFR